MLHGRMTEPGLVSKSPGRVHKDAGEQPLYLSEFHLLISERGPIILASSQTLWENKMGKGHECPSYLLYTDGCS